MVVYSDMNGFGHFRLPTLALITYWGAFCVLLLVFANVLFPRGAEAGAVERVREAVARIHRHTTVSVVTATLTFGIVGGWIYYNTHILNRYETTESRLHARADYERRSARTGAGRDHRWSPLRPLSILFPSSAGSRYGVSRRFATTAIRRSPSSCFRWILA